MIANIGEIRVLPFPGELRLVQGRDNRPRIVGRAAPYGVLSQDLGGFKEQFLPGCFTETIASDEETLALVEHNPGLPLGRKSEGTLIFRDAPDGLYVEIDPADTTIGADAMENIRSRIFKGMSVHFAKGATDSWVYGAGGPIRSIHKAKLRDVSLTIIPAYLTTTAALAGDASPRHMTTEKKERRRRQMLLEMEFGNPRPRLTLNERRLMLMKL